MTLGSSGAFSTPGNNAVTSGLSLNADMLFGNNDDLLNVNIGAGNTLTGQVDGGGSA